MNGSVNGGKIPPNGVEIPIIQQMFNTCGLASILMLSHDPSRSEIHQNLMKLLEIIQPLIKDECQKMLNSLCLQYAVQYLLLKIQHQEARNFHFLHNYLHGKYGYTFDDQETVLSYMMKTKMQQFLETQDFLLFDSYRLFLEHHGLITPHLLRNEMLTMKSDLELKFLMEPLGFSFESHETGDGTGALYIPVKKVRNRKEGLKFIHRLKKFANQPNKRVLYGFANHWVAVSYISEVDIDNPLIYYVDPMTSSVKQAGVEFLDESHRFYVFTRNRINYSKLWKNILEISKETVKIERKLQETHSVDKVLAARSEKNSKDALFSILNQESSKNQNHEDDWDVEIDFEFEDK